MAPCPMPSQETKELSDYSDHQYHSNNLSTDSSTSNTSLYSQPSLPSVPSLTPLLHQHGLPSTTHHHCLSTLKGHSSNVFSLFLAGKHLYSGSSDSQIRIWTRDSNPISADDNVVASAQSAVKAIVVMGDKLFSAHQDHKIRVWKIEDDSNTCSNHQKLRCVASLPTLNDRVMRLFSAGNYVEIRRHKKSTWVHHVDAISALALSKDQSLLYSVSWDRTLKVWRTSDFKCLESVWNAHDDAINSIAVSGDGFVYTGSADRKIKVWRRGGDKKQRLVTTLEKHKSAVNALALSADGSVLYSGACDRSIIVWEKDGGSDGGEGHMVVAGALRGHTKAILCLVVVADLVVSGSADKSVRIWRRGIGRSYCCLLVLEGHSGPVKCLAADFDYTNPELDSSYLVYSGSLDCDIKVWQIRVDE